MKKALKLKEIFEKKIETLNKYIRQYNDSYNEVTKENRNKSITVSKYEQNQAKMTQYARLVDTLVSELRVYRAVLKIVNNVIDTAD